MVKERMRLENMPKRKKEYDLKVALAFFGGFFIRDILDGKSIQEINDHLRQTLETMGVKESKSTS